MGFLARIDHHTNLFQTMADTVGVDLSEAVFRGQLPPEALRGAVLSCTACEGAADCPGWLAENAGGSRAAPAYCRNGSLLENLRAD
jgi:hypothetical protein